MNKQAASQTALGLIRTGLESQTIKLYGSGGAANSAEKDAAYLTTLYDKLTEHFSKPDVQAE